MTPWPLSVEMDAAALVYVLYDHVCSQATPIRPIRPHTKDLLYGLCLLVVSGARCRHLCRTVGTLSPGRLIATLI